MKRVFVLALTGILALTAMATPLETRADARMGARNEGRPRALAPAQSRPIIVDHTAIALFDRIPDRYIRAARELRMIYFDKSVGANIDSGLDCLQHPSANAAPVGCKRPDPVTGQSTGLAANIKYDRSTWRYQWWPERGCSAWYELVSCFIAQAGPVVAQYDVLSFQFSYGEVGAGSTIADKSAGFFANNKAVNDIYDYEAFAARYPGKQFILWTTSLSRGVGTAESTDFNNQMRAYARANNKILFDVADIEAHDPAGKPCFDNRDGVRYCEPNNPAKCENFPDDKFDYPAICPNYTTEMNAGHLNSMGKVRLAKAFWVLMAQVAGWMP